MTRFFDRSQGRGSLIDKRPFYKTVIIKTLVALSIFTWIPEKNIQRGRNTMQGGLEYGGLQRENYLESILA
jgi:hypothetical protein